MSGFFFGGMAEGVDRSANTVLDAVNKQRQLKFQEHQVATQVYMQQQQMAQKQKEMDMQQNINKFNQWKGTLETYNNAAKAAKDLPPAMQKSYMQAVVGESPYFANNPALKQLIDQYPDEPEFQAKIAKITQGAHKDLIAGKSVLPHILALKGMGIDTTYFEKEIGYKATQQVNKLLSEGVQQPTGMVGQTNLQRNLNMPTEQGLLNGQSNIQEKTVTRPATLGDFSNLTGMLPKDSLERKMLEDKLVPKDVKDATAIEEYKYAVGQGYNKSFEEWKKSVKKAGATNVNVNQGGKEAWKVLGEGLAKEFIKRKEDAGSALKSLDTVKTGRELLDGDLITGTGANIRLEFGRALATLGMADPNKNAVANTDAYIANMGKQVGEVIRLFGSGTGLSDADRQYAEKIAGGKITATKESLSKILDINEKAARNVIKNYNKEALKIKNKPNAAELPFDITIEEPPPFTKPQTAAQGLPQDVASKLHESVITTFGNGQQWTLKNGKPQRIK